MTVRPDSNMTAPASVGSGTGPAARTRWLTVAAGVGAGMICGLQVGKAPPMIGAIRDELALGLVGAGFYMSAINGVAVLTGIAAGVMADRIGRRRAVALGLCIIILGNLLGAVADNAPLLYLSRLLEASGLVAIVTGAPGLIAEASAPADMRRALSGWSIYMPAGFSTMMLAAPLIADPADWRTIWWLNAGLVTLFLGKFLWLTRDLPPAQRSGRGFAGLRSVVRLPGPWLLGLIFMTYTAQWFGLLSWLPTIMAQAGVTETGTALALVVAANMIGCLGSGPLLARGIPRWQFLVFCSLSLSVLAFGIYDDTIAPGLRLAMAGLFSAIGGLIPGGVLSGAQFHSPSPQTVGTTNGVIVQCTNLGSVVGPPLAAWIAVMAGGDFSSARWMILAAGLCGVALALGLRQVESRMTS